MNSDLSGPKLNRMLSSSAVLSKFLGKATDIKMTQILDNLSEDEMIYRRTGIVCTMGPACWSVDQLVKLYDAGLNICRLNFSHGDFTSHGQTVKNIREALQQRPNKRVAIMLDTKGPEIRTGMLKDGKSIELQAGQILKISTNYSQLGDANEIACSYHLLPESVSVGGTILMADGTIVLKVTEIGKSFVCCKVMNNALLGERKNMNLPGVKVKLPVLGQKDKSDLVDFGLREDINIDMVAASFVQSAADVQTIRKALGEKGKHVKIIPKIENVEGILSFDEILAASDGIMVARGDMGMELPPEKVFLAQKMMIAKCNVAGKPVITATQMLESMHINPRPTRAEVADVANAVLDGTDCVMLSGETANGRFPVEAVQIMGRICYEAEQCIDYPILYRAMTGSVPRPISTEEAVCAAAVETAEGVDAKLILALTETGRTAQLLAKYRPKQLIVAITPSERVARQLKLHRAVFPELVSSIKGTEEVLSRALQRAKDFRYVDKGDIVVAVHGMFESTPGGTNMLKVVPTP